MGFSRCHVLAWLAAAGLALAVLPATGTVAASECGNMRNAADAKLLVSPGGQRDIAAALAAAITRFVTAR